MTRNFKNRPASVRFAMIATVMSVIAPIGGQWHQSMPEARADGRVVSFDADHPVTRVPVFAQDPGYVASVD